MATHNSHHYLQVFVLLAVSTQLLQAQIAVPILDTVCDAENTACFTGTCSNCLAVYSRPDTNSSYVDIALRGDISGSGWVGLGLSKSGKMPDSSVMACIGDSGTVVVKNYYNQNSGYGSAPASDENVGLTLVNSEITAGTLHCSFRRDIAISAANDADVFPLDTNYTLLLGQGPLSGGALAFHSTIPAKTSSPVDIAGGAQSKTASVSDSRIKAHACLMVTAWVLCASVGIMMARFYKKDWAEQSLCKEKVWFAIHRGCMVSALVCTVLGFILIFAEVQGYSVMDSSVAGYKKAHPPLGIIVTCLVIINPLMALARPHPDTKYRPLFNWAHWGVGQGAYVLAVITVFFGMTLGNAATFAPIELRYVMAAFVALNTVITIILEIIRCADVRGDGKRDMQFEMKQAGATPDNAAPSSNKYGAVRAYLIYFYIFCAFGLWLGMILIMGLGLGV